jgi:tetratricopeptide (TPR) repeat protein
MNHQLIIRAVRNKLTWVLALILVSASTAMAAGSSSTSRPPAASPAQPTSYDLGVKAVQAGDYARALTLLQKVVQTDPRNADAWNYIGFSHRNLKQFDQSLAAYQKALDINPDHRGANEYLGELYLQTGDLTKAQGRLDKLGALCSSGCKELDDLKRAVKAYESAHKKG